MYRQISEDLLTFIKNSPTSFHAVSTMADVLSMAGFTALSEEEPWDIAYGGRYFVTRNGSSLIAFTVPAHPFAGVHILASHSDSPSFKIKENPEMAAENRYVKLNVEGYGGMLMAPWFDRPLSVAGRVIVSEDGRLAEKLVNIDRDLVLIPNVAIHMNREVNSGYSYNIQQDLLPLYGDLTAKDTFLPAVAEAAGVAPGDILGHDLYLYNRQPGTVWGASGEFLSSGRLDDLQCAFASLIGFLQGKKEAYLNLHCVFDNEEVGSATRQGAGSTFLHDVMVRLHASLGLSREEYLINLAKGFMISADNAHAVHPNHPEKADPVNRPALNAGIVLKFHAGQRYCTDGVSAAMFRQLCQKADVPTQVFTNRSDMPGGSTLGNISNTKVALKSVDIGLPQLAMHSPYETAGTKDTAYLVKAAAEFFC